MLKAAPSFSAIAVLVIALGIGATAAIFSLVNAVLLRSLPFGDPQNLVYLWSPNARFTGAPREVAPNVPDFYDWQRLSHSFSSVALLERKAANFVRGGSASRIGVAFVTGEFFRTLEVLPELGRSIDKRDDQPGHEQVAVIGDAFWRSHFASDPQILGKQIQFNRKQYTVIGVMPKEFGFPSDNDIPYAHSGFAQTDVWLPLAYTADQKSNRKDFASGDAAIGRLRRGVSAPAAQQELKTIESRLDPLYPEMWRGWTALVTPLVETIIGPVEKMLWLLLGAVGLVLLIAISNVANLLLTRVTARAHEMGIRAALGAGRSRLIRQLLTDSLLLSCLGGALGIGLAYAAVHLLAKLNPGNIPRFEAASVDLRVLLIAVALSIATGVLCGLAPTLSGSRASLNQLLRQSDNRGIAGTSNRARHALVIVEVALSVMLLTGAGLLIRSYLQLEAVNPGFSPSTLTFELDLDEHYSKPEQRIVFYKNFLQKLQALPGVRNAGAASETPLNGGDSIAFVDVRGFGKSKEMVENRSVTPDFRKALGTPLLRGRDFTPYDLNSKTPVAMVNQSFAKAYFHGRDPLGQQVRSGIGDFSGVWWATVVGMVADVRHTKLEEAGQPQIFGPYQTGIDNNGANFAIRSSLPAGQTTGEARQALKSLDPTLTLADIHTLGERIDQNNARRRFQTTLLTGFAALAVALALVGLYGLMSYGVKQRTAEIGVRIAVGASRVQVLSLILRQGLGLTLAGLAVGLAGALAATRLLSSWLFGVSAADPLTFIVVPLFVLLVAACACLFPALGAMRIDPVVALRQE
ncbi:MAG: ABC transporter permease [Acidobacteriota bacterium]|nr:ABC transporter permease [Acidobacteriota bacterium]